MTLSRSLKQKKCKNPACRASFAPARAFQKACGVDCAVVVGRLENEKKAKKAAKAERIADGLKRTAMKTRRQWIAECQVVINRYCRLRDLRKGYGCISCGAKPAQAFGGTMDGGHYRSVGSAPHLRFFTPQITLQCVRCNRDLGGNAVETRRGLVGRHGLAFVELIESMQGSAKWSVEYLIRLKRIFTRKANRMQKRIDAMKEFA
jgi:hypothetical protein